MFRSDGRPNDQPRNVTITPSFLVFPEGSALIEVGETKVVCTATLEERVPPFLRGQGKGWITAEYNMLPRSTLTRTPREREAGRVSGRTLEIQRLIGRSLRAVGDMTALGERTLVVDCDVCKPTAALARPPSPAHTSPSTRQCCTWSKRALSAPYPSKARWPP